jgi:hypothetical protein
MIDEKTHMWNTLSGRYGDLAWAMLEDMKGKRFRHKSVSKHLTYIMNNWPDEEVCRTVRTWLCNSMCCTSLSEEFLDKYKDYISDYIEKNKYFEKWPKPSKFDNK